MPPPNRGERLSFLDHLENIVCSLPKSRNWIILGDLNIRIGKEEFYIHDGVIGNAAIPQPNREDSRKLLELCRSFSLKIENTFFFHNESNTLTYRRNNITSQIDFFISNIHGWFTDVKALRNINISDHKLIKANLLIKNLWGNSQRLPTSNQPRFSPWTNNATSNLPRFSPWTTNAKNLLRPEVKLLLGQNLRDRMTAREITSESVSTEACWSSFKSILFGACNDLPNINGSPSSHEWLSDDTVLLIAELRSLDRRDGALWTTIHRLLRRDRRIYIAKKAFEIDRDIRENRTFDAYKKLKLFCSERVFKPLPSIRLDNNKLITDPDEQMALWLDHYMETFDSRRRVVFPSSSRSAVSSDANFSVVEITKAIKKLRNNKSPGPDNILGEHLKAAPLEVSQLLLGLFNMIWVTGKMPASVYMAENLMEATPIPNLPLPP
ncbi:uncharacterized protein LOC135924235 [Gordionus sp. m RMFG-2023]|uniref:uncharacterized protein LOC135924235 n=1 Tax=Gordionus sp. m RMFG-2023 TaxID=3053472 RepID=UPI0031FCEC5A